MALPKLEFGKTKLLGDAAELGMENLPDPDTIEYASPERAGVIESDEPPPEASEEPAAAEASKEPETIEELTGEGEYAKEPETKEETDEIDGDFTPDLLELAAKYGYDADAARRFGSKENLEWAMADADRRAAEWGARLQAQPEQPQLPPGQPQPPQAQQPQPPQDNQQQKQFKLDAEELRRQGFDDDTVNLLTSMDEFYRGQIGQLQQVAVNLHGKLEQTTGHVQADEEAQFERDMDAFFDGLGSEWADEFGAGPMRNLPEGTAAKENRRKIAATVFGLKASDAQLNQKFTDAERARRALNSDPSYFKKQQELARKALAGVAGKRRSQTVARAGTNRSTPMTGEDKATRRAEAFAKKHGLYSR